jgi:hypothetical protein
MPAYAAQVYRSLGSLTLPDPNNGFALAALVDALSTVGSWIYDAAHPEPGSGESPWSAVVDPTRCPWWALRWCGQVYGLRLEPQLDAWVRPSAAVEASWRLAISERVGWHRGHVNSIAAAARAHMGGQQRVSIRERYDPDLGAEVDAPYHLSIRISATDLLAGRDAAVVRDVLAAVPIGLVAHVEISDALTYDDLPVDHPDYDALGVAFSSYDAMEAT